jgi:hypothetical protein
VRIALVSPYDFTYPGGANEHIAHLAAEYRELGHGVRILAPAARGRRPPADPDFYRVGTPVPIHGNGSVARITLSLTLSHRVKEILARERIAAASDEEGWLLLAHKPSRLAALEATRGLLRDAFGFETELLTRDEVRDELVKRLGPDVAPAGAVDRDAVARLERLGLVRRLVGSAGEALTLTQRGRLLGGGVTADLLA